MNHIKVTNARFLKASRFTTTTAAAWPQGWRKARCHDTLDSLLAASDVLSLHCPATPQTTGMMDAAAFARLPEGAILVNTARGALVDEGALVAALNFGRLFAAGLDVYRSEPGGNPALSALENVLLLPHIGSATTQARDAMGFRALDNLDAVFAGREPGDRVA